MECVKNTWISLMCCANELLKNGITFFSEVENNYTDNRNEKIIGLHRQILEMKTKLDALDEGLWRHLTTSTSTSLPNTAILAIQEPTHAPTMQIANSVSTELMQNGNHGPTPLNNEIVTQRRAYRSANLSILASNICDMLKRRYEGFPYPPEAVIYKAEDEKMDAEVFGAKFPVNEHDDPNFGNNNNEETFPSVSKLKYQMNITGDTTSVKPLRPGRLTSGPPRKPRGSRPHPYENANAYQKEVLSKPSLLAIPRKERQMLEKEKEQRIIEKPSRKGKTRQVIDHCEDTPVIKKTKVEEIPKKSAKPKTSPATPKTSTITRNTKKDAQDKSISKSKIPLTTDAKQGELITGHFVSKKSYSKMHTRSSKKLETFLTMTT